MYYQGQVNRYQVIFDINLTHSLMIDRLRIRFLHLHEIFKSKN